MSIATVRDIYRYPVKSRIYASVETAGPVRRGAPVRLLEG